MFNKLPSNSEKLLLELVQAESASQVLQAKYEGITHKERDVLDGMVRELISFGYISAKWADNIPYIVNLSNSARTYREQLMAFEEKKIVAAQKMVVFISHRSTDKAIADMLVDFLTGTGIPKTSFFCSSLPGNDINEKISAEVKAALKDSILNIAILSRDYYQSAYCLNEAGVLWYREDVPVIPIALPDIDSKNMYGFLNNEYKLRRLDSDTDISYIYDAVSEVVSALPCKASVITYEAQKLKERYFSHLDLREEPETTSSPIDVEGITTDDERIILYYLISNGIRKVSKAVVSDWLRKNEIHDVNVDNAFDLLSCIEGGAISGDTLEFGIHAFRNYSTNSLEILPALKMCVERHTRLAAEEFVRLWNSGTISSELKLFIAYIIEERVNKLGCQWMAKCQTASIKEWEDKNRLDNSLSFNYESCLAFFEQNDFVYPSSWTSGGNVRECTICTSLQDLFFNHSDPFTEELQKIKKEYHFDLPF